MKESPWAEEKRSAFLYRVLADVEAGSPAGELFEKLGKEAEEQAEVWAAKARKEGRPVPAGYVPDVRARLVAALARRLGAQRMRPILAATKVRGLAFYSSRLPASGPPLHPIEMERRHRGGGTGGVLRAAVFGVSDGLVSNASLIMGVAGAAHDPAVVLLGGTAGLMAGAFSMAAGEYISVRSQREMFEYQIGLEADELREYPEAEATELAAIYEAKGLAKEEARKIATTLVKDPERALDTLAREELGLNPDQLGSPWGAAASSFGTFAVGAFVPLLPFIVTSGPKAVLISALLTAVALFGVGAALSLFTGRHTFRGGFRMLLLGALAASATYLIGRWLGVNVL